MTAHYLRLRPPQSQTSIIYRLIPDKFKFSTKPATVVEQLSTRRVPPSRKDKIESSAHPLVFDPFKSFPSRARSASQKANCRCRDCLRQLTLCLSMSTRRRDGFLADALRLGAWRKWDDAEPEHPRIIPGSASLVPGSAGTIPGSVATGIRSQGVDLARCFSQPRSVTPGNR
jgi:hypothetical protein